MYMFLYGFRFVCIHFLVVLFGITFANAGPMIKDTGLRVGENMGVSLFLERVQDSGADEGILELVVYVGDVKNLRGYGFAFEYDPVKYEFLGAFRGSDQFMGENFDGYLFMVSDDKKGKVTVSGMRVDGYGSNGRGVLGKFLFGTSKDNWRNPSELDFRVLDGVIIDVSSGANPIVGVEVGSMKGIPKVCSLEQNIPNPFNPSTSIGYRLPEAGRVKLVVYNVLGQVVRVLVDDVHDAGFYTVVWDGKDNMGRGVASGVYGYRMTSGDFTYWRKMVFLK